MFKMQATLIINEIMLGTTGDNGKLVVYEPRHEKTNILVSDRVLHKPGCTATEDG